MSGIKRLGLVSGDYASSSEEDFDDSSKSSKTESHKEEQPKIDEESSKDLFGLAGRDESDAEYSSEDDESPSSSQESNDNGDNEDAKSSPSKTSGSALPNFLGDAPSGEKVLSIYSNQYRDRELAKTAVLEQHVKLTEPKAKPNPNRRLANKKKGKSRTAPVTDGNGSDDQAESSKKRKVRVGISNTLVPPKKALQQLDRLRANERPWTNNLEK